MCILRSYKIQKTHMSGLHNHNVACLKVSQTLDSSEEKLPPKPILMGTTMKETPERAAG